MRAPAGWAGRAAAVLAAALAGYSLYWVLFIVQPQVYRVSFLLVALVLTFLLFPAFAKASASAKATADKPADKPAGKPAERRVPGRPGAGPSGPPCGKPDTIVGFGNAHDHPPDSRRVDT